MAVLQECPICNHKLPIKNKKCRCGQNLDTIRKNGFTFHDLRHTFNTNARKAGVPESVIMEITRHESRKMFDRVQYH